MACCSLLWPSVACCRLPKTAVDNVCRSCVKPVCRLRHSVTHPSAQPVQIPYYDSPQWPVKHLSTRHGFSEKLRGSSPPPNRRLKADNDDLQKRGFRAGVSLLWHFGSQKEARSTHIEPRLSRPTSDQDLCLGSEMGEPFLCRLFFFRNPEGLQKSEGRNASPWCRYARNEALGFFSNPP